MSKTITYEEYREYLKQFNPAHYSPAKWYSLTKDESEKAKAHLLVIRRRDVFAINPTDIENESTLHSLILYFRGRLPFAETAKAIEIAAMPLLSAVRKELDNE
tara:strand:+ start:60 stop:368 length:309 start_codon:yes stop_codon:yes gene_type:complete